MREHPRRRRFQVIRHAAPEEALAAMTEPATAELPAVQDEPMHTREDLEAVAALESRADVSRETREEVPPLSRAQVLHLEALTAVWERQVRQAGPPDATMLYAAPRSLPPVPPAQTPRPGPVVETLPAVPTAAEVAAAEATSRVTESVDEVTILTPELAAAVLSPTGPARRLHGWTSRHDPASLEYAVRGRLRAQVPLQDVLLDRGPVLDQGTTPPLTPREASGCVGMAVVAAANVLDASSRSAYARPEPGTFLGLDDARRAYELAQRRDHVAGESYAGVASVLAGMKAGQELGWWDTYLWALGGTKDIAQVLLQLRTAVVLGLPWDAGLEDPDAAGIIAPGGASAGGHALAVVGLRRTVAGRPGWWFVLQQSRGELEGDGGLVYLHHKHLAGLLGGVGEAGVPLPRWAT